MTFKSREVTAMCVWYWRGPISLEWLMIRMMIRSGIVFGAILTSNAKGYFFTAQS